MMFVSLWFWVVVYSWQEKKSEIKLSSFLKTKNPGIVIDVGAKGFEPLTPWV